jgi:hypothetical protein
MRSVVAVGVFLTFCLLFLEPQLVMSACCYFAAKDKDIQQPAQKAFITWEPNEKVETFTVQPKFQGNAADFGMVIPTPSRPKLDEMPRDFFKELAVFTLLKKREQAYSRLLPLRWGGMGGFGGGGFGGGGFGGGGFGGVMAPPPPPKPPTVKVLETGVVGSLDYKILAAERADDLFKWLKEHKYSYSGDEATLDFYVKKKWFFTVMKIDTMQMKRNQDGSFDGEVTPTRFQFTSEKLIYPLKITQLSVKDKTEALFYVQAPFKVDLPGEMTYQYQWIPMLQNARGWFDKGIFGEKGLPGKGNEWLRATEKETPDLLKRGDELGFKFVSGQRPAPNQDGRIATTLEWAKKLTFHDIKLLRGKAPYADQLPDVDIGFSESQIRDRRIGPIVANVIEGRLADCKRKHPGGYMLREAPAADIQHLQILAGHLHEGQFVTKFRKTFVKGEMDDDLLIIPAKLGDAEDKSEYEEILPTSPP